MSLESLPIQEQRLARRVLRTGLASHQELEAARAVWQDAHASGANLTLSEALIRVGVLSGSGTRVRRRVQRSGSPVPGDRMVRQLGPYRLLEKLGEGAMGGVYLAEDTLLARKVAVKILAPKYGMDPMYLGRFEREGKAAGNLNHENIAGAYAVGHEHGFHFYVMEYCEGCSLGDRLLTQGVLPWREALEYLIQTARGLGYAHRHGLIHRDIKPDNLFLTQGKVIKILDLGLARDLDAQGQARLTQTGTTVGTPHYLSPEQARAASDLDGRADLYSLGATFYDLLTGQPPFDGENAALVMAQLLTADFRCVADLNAEVPEGLSQVIDRLLAREREDRYQDCEALIADLERVRAGGLPLEVAQEEDEARAAVRAVPAGRRRRLVQRQDPSRVRGTAGGGRFPRRAGPSQQADPGASGTGGSARPWMGSWTVARSGALAAAVLVVLLACWLRPAASNSTAPAPLQAKPSGGEVVRAGSPAGPGHLGAPLLAPRAPAPQPAAVVATPAASPARTVLVPAQVAPPGVPAAPVVGSGKGVLGGEELEDWQRVEYWSDALDMRPLIKGDSEEMRRKGWPWSRYETGPVTVNEKTRFVDVQMAGWPPKAYDLQLEVVRPSGDSNLCIHLLRGGLPEILVFRFVAQAVTFSLLKPEPPKSGGNGADATKAEAKKVIGIRLDGAARCSQTFNLPQQSGLRHRIFIRVQAQAIKACLEGLPACDWSEGKGLLDPALPPGAVSSGLPLLGPMAAGPYMSLERYLLKSRDTGLLGVKDIAFPLPGNSVAEKVPTACPGSDPELADAGAFFKDAYWAGAKDLLALRLPGKGIQGSGMMVFGTQPGSRPAGPVWSTYEIPMAPSGAHDLLLEFEAEPAEGLGLWLPPPGGGASFGLYRDREAIYLLVPVQEKGQPRIHKQKVALPWVSGRRHTLVLRVRRASIQVLLEGRLALQWKEGTDLPIWKPVRPPGGQEIKGLPMSASAGMLLHRYLYLDRDGQRAGGEAGKGVERPAPGVGKAAPGDPPRK